MSIIARNAPGHTYCISMHCHLLTSQFLSFFLKAGKVGQWVTEELTKVKKYAEAFDFGQEALVFMKNLSRGTKCLKHATLDFTYLYLIQAL